MLISFHSYKGGTGKTNIIGNLGTYLAQRGHKVGIIDIDVYGSGMPSLFNLDYDNSFVEYLKNECIVGDALYKPDPKKELYIVPTRVCEEDFTTFFKTPADAKTKMLEFITYLQEEAGIEHLLFDCGPGINKSSLLIMNIVDRAITVSTIDRQDVRGIYIITKVGQKLRANSSLLFNKVPTDKPEEIKVIIKSFCEQLNIELLGTIDFDETVADTWSRRVVIESDPECGFSSQIRDIYSKIFD